MDILNCLSFLETGLVFRFDLLKVFVFLVEDRYFVCVFACLVAKKMQE